MNIKPMHEAFKCPEKGTDLSGGYDLFMPEAGNLYYDEPAALIVKLGFAAEVPEGYVGLIVPRSGKGVKNGLALNNTVGVIDADYRGEWMAALRLQNHRPMSWEAGDRLLQVLFVKAESVDLNVVEDLDDTARGDGGWGSTGV